MLKILKSSVSAVILSSVLLGGAFAGEVKSIAILTPEEGTDYGWNQQGIDAAKAAGKAAGVEVVVAQGLGYGDVRPTLRELASDGASLLIAHASGYNTSAPEIAKELKVPVAIVDTPTGLEKGLVADYTLSGHQGAYLAGRLAAKMSRSKSVGIVVSGEPPSWNSQSAAFAQGVKAENPDVKITYAVIGPAAYSDAAGGKRVTESVIASGADIIFGQGNGSSFGMLQAVETAKNKTWFIDVIGDKTKIDKGNLLSSVVWDMVPVYTQMVEDLKADKFGTHEYAISLKDNSVELLHTKHIPDDVWKSLEDLRAKIIDGSVKVDRIEDAQKVRALMSSVDPGPAQ